MGTGPLSRRKTGIGRSIEQPVLSWDTGKGQWGLGRCLGERLGLDWKATRTACVELGYR